METLNLLPLSPLSAACLLRGRYLCSSTEHTTMMSGRMRGHGGQAKEVVDQAWFSELTWFR